MSAITNHLASSADRGFIVDHQKVSIDVDLYDKSIQGLTELTIIPIDANFTEITLDCRQCQIERVELNGKKVPFNYTDPLHTVLSTQSTASQYHLYLNKLQNEVSPLSLGGELVIPLPKAFRLTTEGSGTDVSYVPILLTIVYSVDQPVSGLNFVGMEGEKESWHVYSTHTALGQSTSCWVPCLDGLWSHCTWQLEFSIPKTLDDILVDGKVNGPKTSTDEESKVENRTLDTDHKNSNEESPEVIVVCNSHIPSEIAHPTNPAKKIVTFNVALPTAAQHIGFAVGPFVSFPMADLRENEDEDGGIDHDSSSAPVFIYCLSKQKPNAENTCVFLYKAMEFFAREYGSYPFPAYSLCFVDEADLDFASATGLTLCSSRLLCPPEVIEPLFTSTETISEALATQWCGVSVVPKEWNDMWCVVGLASYMGMQFLRKLFGNNDYRFRVKRRSEKLCKADIGKPPLAFPNLMFPITDSSLEFIKLKAPAVLFILDRRMTKTERSLGLSRVIPKLFLQSMSGDLAGSCLSSQHFIKLCERVSHKQLTSFFDQWIFGSGYPIFRVTQRFNKKRMFIEMGIRQVQVEERRPKPIRAETLTSDYAREVEEQDGEGATAYEPQIFTGPMTIRIHEADGTPYEHVVDLKEAFTKLDIQYNTKYKRLKRNRKNKGTEPHVDVNVEDEGADLEGVLLHCLGDVLQSDEDLAEWKLSDWSTEEETRMTNEAFEWIRVDADFEWICEQHINQPDYMFASQLQQDRDVIAQYEAVRHFAHQKPSKLVSSILLRTIIDRRYFYGIRTEAVKAIVSAAAEETDYIGKFHLMKAFQHLFCFDSSVIPRANDFSDFPTYFIQKAIPGALAKIRTPQGECPDDVKSFLVDLLRYNENSSNAFSDSYYLCELISAIVESLKIDDLSLGTPSGIQRALQEIERCQLMDHWIPSFQYSVTIVAIRKRLELVVGGYVPPRREELLQYTMVDKNANVRIEAFKSLFILGGLRDTKILEYALISACNDDSNYVRHGIIQSLAEAVGIIAVNGEYRSKKKTASDGLVFDSVTAMGSRQERLARESVRGAVDLVRQTLGRDEKLKKDLWYVINNEYLGLESKLKLLDICQVLYVPVDSYVVTLKLPNRYRLGVVYDGGTMVTFKRMAISGGDLKKNENKSTKIKLRGIEDRNPTLSPAPKKLKIKIKGL